MADIIISPSKYIQGKGVIKELSKYVNVRAKKIFCLISGSGYKRVGEFVESDFEKSDSSIIIKIFEGECIYKDINEVAKQAQNAQCDAVMAIGGGKIIDTAKAAAEIIGAMCFVVPTVASTDAPCSALSIIYDEKGDIADFMFLKKNPDMVIVDCEVVAKAPVRLLSAGMGDALSTYIEAKKAYAANGINCSGGTSTNAAYALAKLCYEIIKNDGYKAYQAVKNGVCTKAVENVIEANTYLSGIGFESCGLCAAHPINEGLSLIKECEPYYHGEKVAFGALTQLVLENAPMEEITEIMEVLHSVHLPITLAELGITQNIDENLKIAAAHAAGANTAIHNLPMEVTTETVFAALKTADAFGREFKKARE